MTTFDVADFSKLWMLYVHPRCYEHARELVIPLGAIMVQDAAVPLRFYYPLFSLALEHCERTENPMMLRVILFHFIAFHPEVRRWALTDRTVEWLPSGAELSCVLGIRGLCCAYASMKLTMEELDKRIFFVLTTGCSSIGSPSWRMPPVDSASAVDFVKRQRAIEKTDDEILLLLRRSIANKKRRRAAAAGRNGAGIEFEDPEDLDARRLKRCRKKRVICDARDAAVPLGKRKRNGTKRTDKGVSVGVGERATP